MSCGKTREDPVRIPQKVIRFEECFFVLRNRIEVSFVTKMFFFSGFRGFPRGVKGDLQVGTRNEVKNEFRIRKTPVHGCLLFGV